MILGGVNFSLHFVAFRDFSFKSYIRDPEFCVFMKYIITIWVITTAVLVFYESEVMSFDNLRLVLFDNVLDSLFHVISLGTTTGFVSGGFSLWPSFLPFLAVYLGIIGGCAGSTSGGLKIIRMYLLHKQGMHEIKQLIHPQGKFFIKYGDKILTTKVTNGVWGFMAAYLAIFIFLMLLLIGDGVDFTTAFSGVASGLSNIGPALGGFADHFAGGDNFSKLVISGAMLLGRLEIFTVLVLFSPYFWNDT